MTRIKNPFIYGEAVSGTNFCNREKEIEKLTFDLLDSQKIFLISQRRFGKTSLIKVVLEKIKKQGVKTIYLDIEGLSTYKRFLNAYLNALVKEFSPLDKIYEFIRKILLGVRVEIEVDETGYPTLSLGYRPEDPELDSVAARIYELPSKIVGKHQLVIAFDEFQEILKLNGKNVEMALRAAIQHQRNIGYIFAGSRTHLISDMVNSATRPFYKIGPVVFLNKIAEEEFTNFIIHKFSPIKIPKEIAHRIINLTNNIPYYTQMLAHELWDYAMIGERKEIYERDVDAVFEQLIKQYDQNFREDWSKLISSKKQVLHAIATYGGKSPFSREFLEKAEMGPPSSVQRTIESLLDDGYIDKINDEYYIVDILFREWIKRNIK